MEILITADPRGLSPASHARLEQTLRGILGVGAARIPQVIVCLEDLDASRGRWGWECRLYARLIPSGAKAVCVDGPDPESALRGAAELLARALRSEPGSDAPAGRAVAERPLEFECR